MISPKSTFNFKALRRLTSARFIVLLLLAGGGCGNSGQTQAIGDLDAVDFTDTNNEEVDHFDKDDDNFDSIVEKDLDFAEENEEKSDIEELDDDEPDSEICLASDPQIYPNGVECSLPERKLSRWILDFPRMFPDGGWTHIEHSYDGSVVFSGSGNIILIPPNEEPTTFFPENVYVLHTVEGDHREWYAAGGTPRGDVLYRFREGDSQWHLEYENFSDGPYIVDDLDVDSNGTIWSWSTGIFRSFTRWDGNVATTVQVTDANENTMHNSSDRLFECGGYTYFFGGIKYEENPAMTAAIFRVTEEEDALDLIWQAPDESFTTSFYSATIQPETCEFYAGGSNLHVEGMLSDPASITNYVPSGEIGNHQPLMSWKDWSTGIVYGSKSVYPNNPNNDGASFFFIKQPGMEDFEGIEPTWPCTGYGGWAAYQMYGLGVDSLYAPGAFGHFKYNPQEIRWELAYRHPLLALPGYQSHAYVRSLAVHTACDDRFRVHVTGFRLPVIRRTDCHEWEEAYPDSEGAMALYDDGKEIWVVGERPEVIHGIGDEWSSIQGPTSEWLEGRSVLRVHDGGLYVVGIYDEYGEDSRLYYTSDPQAEPLVWEEVKGIQFPNKFKPIRLLSCGGQAYVQVNNMVYYEPDSTQLYLLQGATAKLYVEFPEEGQYRTHDDRLFFCNEEGIREISGQGETSIEEVVPQIEYSGSPVNLQDAVQMPDGRWIIAPGPYEYDPASGELDHYFAISTHYYSGYNDPYPYIWSFETDGNVFELALLPTGEVLAGGRAGQILIRTTDGQWLGQ